MELAWWVEGLISKTRPHNITDFLKSIEKSESKGDFKLGLEARSEKNPFKCSVNQVHVTLRNHGNSLASTKATNSGLVHNVCVGV